MPRARLSGLIALILVLAVTCIDLLLGASTGGTLNTLRLGVLCPLLVVLGVAISVPAAQRYYTEVVAVGVTLIGFVVTYIAHLGALGGLLVRAGRPRARRALRLLVPGPVVQRRHRRSRAS